MSSLSQKFSDFRYSSIFPWVIAMIVMMAIVIGLFLTNRGSNSKLPNTKTTESVITKPTSLLKNFETAANLQKISESPAIYGPLLFGNSDEVIFTTTDQTITSSKTVLQTTEKFNPSSLYLSDDKSAIINLPNSSYELSLTNSQTAQLPSSIFSVVPIFSTKKQKNEFYYIQKRDKSVAIKVSDDLTFGNPTTIATIEFKVYTPDKIEIRSFRGSPYLLNYTYSSEGKDTIRIYSINQNLQKKLEIPKIVSYSITNDKILLSTSPDNTELPPEFKIVDFVDPEKPVLSSVDFRSELASLDINGKIIASRCSGANGENRIVCLVKKDKLAYYTDENQPDSFVDYNLNTQEIKILIPNLYLSAHTIVFSPNDEMFIFGQENNYLYKVVQ